MVDVQPASNGNLPLPCISLKTPPDELLPQLRTACSNTGFFYLADHGISQQLVDQVFDHARRFFAMSYEKKDAIGFNKWYRGYSPMFPHGKDRKEGFYVGRNYQPGDPLYDRTPFHGSNAMPSKDDAELPHFERDIMQYHQQMENLALRLSSLIFNSFGLIGDHDLTNVPGNFDEPLNALKLIHMPEVPADAKLYTLSDGTADSIFGNGSHTDSGMITILANDGVEGLQIYTGGKWIDVPAVERAFVVNLADMLAVWTNGMYRSTKHRVVRPRGAPTRYSIPFFYDPSFDCVVAPLAQCITADNPCKYQPTTCGQHILNEFAIGLLEVTPQLKAVTARSSAGTQYPIARPAHTGADGSLGASAKFANVDVDDDETSAAGCGAGTSRQAAEACDDGVGCGAALHRQIDDCSDECAAGCGASLHRQLTEEVAHGCGSALRRQQDDDEAAGCGAGMRRQISQSDAAAGGGSALSRQIDNDDDQSVGCGAASCRQLDQHSRANVTVDHDVGAGCGAALKRQNDDRSMADEDASGCGAGMRRQLHEAEEGAAGCGSALRRQLTDKHEEAEETKAEPLTSAHA